MPTKNTFTYRPKDIFYDIESLENVFTIAYYKPLDQTIHIAIIEDDHHNNGSSFLNQFNFSQQVQVLNDMKTKIQRVNHWDIIDPKQVKIENNLNQFIFYNLLPGLYQNITSPIMKRKVLFQLAKQYPDFKELHVIDPKDIQFNPPTNDHLSETITDETADKIDQVMQDSTYAEFKDDFSNFEEVFDPDHPNAGFILGFNSKNYDTPMLQYLFTAWLNGDLKLNPNAQDLEGVSSYTGPKDLKRFSNSLINSPNSWQALQNEANFDELNTVRKVFVKSHRHVDVRLLLGKSNTPSLKKYAAQAGLQILESKAVQDAGTQLGLNTVADYKHLVGDLAAYNISDVFKTKNLFEEEGWQTGFNQHAQLVQRFTTDLNPKTNVDTTNTNFITDVIKPFTNPQAEKETLDDYDHIDLSYPTRQVQADGSIKYVNQDLLDLARDKYQIPEVLYEFYSQYRKAKKPEEGVENVLKEMKDPNSILYGQPISEKGKTLNLWLPGPATNPNNQYSNAYITVSTGGGHGEYARYFEYQELVDYANLARKEQAQILDFFQKHESDKEALKPLVQAYKNKQPFNTQLPLNQLFSSVTSNKINPKTIKEPKNDPKEYKAPIYGENIVHVDVDALYPTLLSNLKTFFRSDLGKDIYAELRAERLKLKMDLPDDPDDWTSQDHLNNLIQLLDKLLLNSATGAADANFDTKIKISNKINAMRIIGNLLITILSIRIAQAGGTPVSINTDGIYLYGLSPKEAQVIIDDWKEEFNLSASPELVNTFISKDSNNRIEVYQINRDGKKHLKIKAGGANFAHAGRPSLENSNDHPGIIDDFLKEMFSKQENPLDEINKDTIKQYLEWRIASAKNSEDPEDIKTLLLQMQWILSSNPNKNRYFIAHPQDDLDVEQVEPLGLNSRNFIVKKDYPQARTVEFITVNKTNKTNDDRAFDIIKHEDLLSPQEFQNMESPQQKLAQEKLEELKHLKATKKLYENAEEFYEDNQELIYSIPQLLNGLSPALKEDLLPEGNQTASKYKTRITSVLKDQISSPGTIRASFTKFANIDQMGILTDDSDLRDMLTNHPTLLDDLDLDQYVNLIYNNWFNWAERHTNLEYNKDGSQRIQHFG